MHFFFKRNIDVKLLTEKSTLDLCNMFPFFPSHFINSQGLWILLPQVPLTSVPSYFRTLLLLPGPLMVPSSGCLSQSILIPLPHVSERDSHLADKCSVTWSDTCYFPPPTSRINTWHSRLLTGANPFLP